MSIDVKTAPETPAESQAPAITIETASFSDYERLRRGEKIESATDVKPSAPAEKPEQKEAGESDPSETEETKEKSESEGEALDGETEPKETETDKPKKKGFQRRVEKLNARISAAQQEAEYWKREAMKVATAGKAPEKTDTAKPATTEGKPNPDDFETHAAYVEALTDYKVDQARKADRAAEQKSRLESDQEKLIRSHRERVEAFSEKTDDFEEMMANLEDVPRSAALEQVILESDHGPELLYELAKDPAEAKRIAKLPPLSAARALGKIEEKLEARLSEAKKPEPKKITQAPKPIEPLTKGSSKVTKTIFDPDTSFADYERMRREQMKRRRG